MDYEFKSSQEINCFGFGNSRITCSAVISAAWSSFAVMFPDLCEFTTRKYIVTNSNPCYTHDEQDKHQRKIGSMNPKSCLRR